MLSRGKINCKPSVNSPYRRRCLQSKNKQPKNHLPLLSSYPDRNWLWWRRKQSASVNISLQSTSTYEDILLLTFVSHTIEWPSYCNFRQRVGSVHPETGWAINVGPCQQAVESVGRWAMRYLDCKSNIIHAHRHRQALHGPLLPPPPPPFIIRPREKF